MKENILNSLKWTEIVENIIFYSYCSESFQFTCKVVQAFTF